MNPDKVQRSKLNTLTDLPNVGKAVAEDLALLGITQPQDLAGRTLMKCTTACAA